MEIWHLTPDARRWPHRVSRGEMVTLEIGTWPVGPGQSVWVASEVVSDGRAPHRLHTDAVWSHNREHNSYWRAQIGPFEDGTVVRYEVHGRGPGGEVASPPVTLRVGPKLHLALLWHQHQPLYKDLRHPTPDGSYRYPWVRLHALRDYYSMAMLLTGYPDVRVTINVTPVLAWQILDYAENGATDRHLDLTRIPAETLSGDEREEILSTFFDARWETQIHPHVRYQELFERRQRGEAMSDEDVRDLQMWSNLAWFGQEFRLGEVPLVTGQVASVRRFVQQERGFTAADIEAMIAEQMKILGAVIPIHRALQDARQIEVSSTPFYHPILPLLMDTDAATVDRPGGTLPRRFAHPEDADAQVDRAADHHANCFGAAPTGMWPAEGAISRPALPLFVEAGMRWVASDGGVLARSGRWGYQVDDPDVLCQAYRAETDAGPLALFFRDAALADHIGFHYHAFSDYEAAAADFLRRVKERFAWRVTGDDDRVLTVVLDGENAWGAYREDARPFLHALYRLLERDAEVRTVTFTEYLEGNPPRRIQRHPLLAQTQVHELFAGSWIDEMGSSPGADLGTWIGEPEENRAWDLLTQVREDLSRSRATLSSAPGAFAAMLAAEGSDWFWWFGADQDSGSDAAFDDLYRMHLDTVYRMLGRRPPRKLRDPIVARATVWTVERPLDAIHVGVRLTIRTTCPGSMTWWTARRPALAGTLAPVGGVMGGSHHHETTIGPFEEEDGAVYFRLYCRSPERDRHGLFCTEEERTVRVLGSEERG